MQSPSKRSAISLVGPPAFSGLQGWADLPDGLLHSIVARLGSFREILGFAATCPSWRAAYSSYPSKSTFLSKFPPLLVQPYVRVQGPLLPSTGGCHELLTCKVIDPANPNTALHCQIPQETLLNMTCIGSSYGNLIYYRNGYCRIVDVFTGVEVSAPRLPPIAKSSILHFYAILTAPLASSNSHLLVSTKSYLFDWPVGSDFWSQVRLPDMFSADQIVEFNGQFILSDGNGHFQSVQLAPQLGLQMITTNKDWSQEHRDMTRVVVCGDMLIVLIPISYELYRLDVSTNAAIVTTMEKLDDWALFFGEERKGTLLSCMSPEQWGGRSNTSYHALGYSEPCTFYGLSDEPDPEPDPVLDTPPAKLAWLLSNCRLEPWGQGSNLSQSASPDSDHWAPPRWGDETYTVQDIPFSQGSGSLEPWGQASNLSHSASLDYNHWNSPASRVSLYVSSNPWAPPPPPQWDDDPNPAQDTPFSQGSVPECPAQPLWLYPSMFYLGGSE